MSVARSGASRISGRRASITSWPTCWPERSEEPRPHRPPGPRGGHPLMSTDPVEDDILSCCALRFDGWKFREATGFNHVRAIDRFFETGWWPPSEYKRLASFFLLQRGLCTWDL